jgi:xanthine dehydrogenase YagS FAD-binding subunit
MEAFEYARPATSREAVKMLASGNAEVLAGGSDLLQRMKDSVSTPGRLVSLRDARDLRGMEYTPAKGLRVGAMVTLEELAAQPDAHRHYRAITQAAEKAASPQIRNVGTVGGNLCQRPRCWYYRNGFGLLAMQDGNSLIPNGENQYHAILGNGGPAYFVSPSNLAPALIAFDAKVRLLSASGSREIPVAELYVTPRSEDESELSLKPGEIITEVVVPPAEGSSAFYEVRQKANFDWPLATAAVALRMNGHAVRSARVVMGQVAPVPWRSPEAEQALAGKTISAQIADDAGKAAVEKATPLSRNAYKVTLARVAVKRAVLRASGMELA